MLLSVSRCTAAPQSTSVFLPACCNFLCNQVSARARELCRISSRSFVLWIYLQLYKRQAAITFYNILQLDLNVSVFSLVCRSGVPTTSVCDRRHVDESMHNSIVIKAPCQIFEQHYGWLTTVKGLFIATSSILLWHFSRVLIRMQSA
jgi:hypothetical protein